MNTDKSLLQSLLENAGYAPSASYDGHSISVESGNVCCFISSLFDQLSYLTGDQLLSAMNELHEAFENATYDVCSDARDIVYHFNSVEYVAER